MKTPKIEVTIARIFAERGIRWQRNGEWFDPTVGDIKDVLAGARKVLTNAPDNTEYDQAGILVRKEDDDMNIYIHLGELL